MVSKSISKHSKLEAIFIVEGITINEDSSAPEPSLAFMVVESSTIEERRIARGGVCSVHLLLARYSPTLKLPLN